MTTPYRTAFIAMNSGHDFIRVKQDLAANIVFVTTGYEAEEDLLPAIEKSLESFDPEQDIIVPVGKVMTNALIGLVLGKLGKQPVFAYWQEQQYHTLDTEVSNV